MPTTLIDIHELPSRFGEMVSIAAAGTEIVITDGNVPRARLIPLTPGGLRVLGLHPGAMEAAADFDAPLPEEFWLGSP